MSGPLLTRSAATGRARTVDRRATTARNDALDGIRALAVAAVMAYHLGVPGAGAGFLGVDVFFVLSGYLITSILLSQVEAGRLDLGGFWVKRVRRLAPALLLAVGAVIAWGALLAPPLLRDGLRADITSTLAYVANWHFIGSGTYFSDTGDESPLQHMWSLAVEEQFYLVWPIALLVVAKTVRHAHARVLAVGLLALTGVAVSASRLHAVWAANAPDRAYMGTDTRIFGPLVGALLAVVLARAGRAGSGRVSNRLLLGSGTALVLWGLVQLDSPVGASSAYAHGGALVVALGSASIIWAVSRRASSATAALSLLPIAYLGRLSYGIYVWHWPLVVWSRENQWLDMGGRPTALRDVTLATATVALAALSYHLIEKPIRYGRVGAHLGRRNIAVALPASLVLLIAVDMMFVVPQAGAVAGSVTKTIVLVGDSVPQRMAMPLSDAAGHRGYVVVSATRGGCPATGVMVVDARGQPTGSGESCPRIVPARQDAMIQRFRPALVIWWSRYEIADRLGDGGALLPTGSRAYWNAQQRSYRARIDSLTRFGATVVTVQIERSGSGMLRRCTPKRCGPLLRRLIERTDLQDRWNAVLSHGSGSRVRSISINALVCHDRASPCDDRLADGTLARPDGTHYSEEAARTVAPAIVARALRAAALR